MILPNYFLYFIACYGICFGFMFKAKWFHKKHSFLDSMFKCSYCTGFWSGLFAWIFIFSPFTSFASESILWVSLSVLGHMFASSAFCYVADTFVQRLEDLKGLLPPVSAVEYIEEEEEDSEDDLSGLGPLERLRAQAQKKVKDNG